MTNQIKDYSPSNIDTIDEYCQEQQETFMRIARGVVNKGHLMNELYQNMLLELPEPKTWDEAFNGYEKLFHDLQHNIIVSRLLKGAEMIDKELDPVKKRRYFEVYSDLEQKLKALA